ncbi:hypothetical protein S40293_01685 [Stachybotrys chartarum IBT 40293]|nr:hypothetical protein S40293_01685 [Stachybotrys chartarum IBT 40293]
MVRSRDIGQAICIKITDFGLAKMAWSYQSDVGTRCYMAPEIWPTNQYDLVPNSYTTAADIWSIGVVVLQFLLPSRAGPSVTALGMRSPLLVLKEEILRAPDNPVLKLLQQMIVENPIKRLSAADAYQAALAICPHAEPHQTQATTQLDSFPSSSTTVATAHEESANEKASGEFVVNNLCTTLGDSRINAVPGPNRAGKRRATDDSSSIAELPPRKRTDGKESFNVADQCGRRRRAREDDVPNSIDVDRTL